MASEAFLFAPGCCTGGGGLVDYRAEAAVALADIQAQLDSCRGDELWLESCVAEVERAVAIGRSLKMAHDSEGTDKHAAAVVLIGGVTSGSCGGCSLRPEQRRTTDKRRHVDGQAPR
jgi:hypothetical protein